VRSLDGTGTVLGRNNVEHVVWLEDRHGISGLDCPLDSGLAGQIRGNVHDTLSRLCLKQLTRDTSLIRSQALGPLALTTD